MARGDGDDGDSRKGRRPRLSGAQGGGGGENSSVEGKKRRANSSGNSNAGGFDPRVHWGMEANDWVSDSIWPS